MNTRSFLWLAVALGALACHKSPDPEPALVGEANMSRYVAVGNSLTAGESNGGLYRASQLSSYPRLLAQQFALSGGRGDFSQPLFSEDQENGSGYLRLTAVSPLTLTRVTDKLAVRSSSPTLYTKFEGDNQNLGVPGLRMADVDRAGYGTTTGNPYFERLLPAGQEQKSYLNYVTDSKPTFFTVSLGENDVLDFVTSGGTQPLTDPGAFAANARKLFDALAASGAKGAVSNVPDATQFPLLLKPSELAASRNDKLGPYWITTGTGDARPATDDDLILITVDSIGYLNRAGFPKGYFKISPLNNDEVLDADEIAQARQATAAYNATLSAEVSARNWALVDLNALFAKARAGFLDFYGNRVEGTFIQGGQVSANSIFSVDAVHPNARGYALIANEFIDAINQTYKASVPKLNIGQFAGLSVSP
jgi:lysophospholipase L1-like esterase